VSRDILVIDCGLYDWGSIPSRGKGACDRHHVQPPSNRGRVLFSLGVERSEYEAHL